MKKINPKYLIAAAIVVVVLVIAIIAFTGKGKDTPIKDDDKAGTNVEETISSESNTNEATDDTEIDGDNLDNNDAEEQKDDAENNIIDNSSSTNIISEEDAAKRAAIDKKNEEKLAKMTEADREKFLNNTNNNMSTNANREKQIIDLNNLNVNFSDTQIYFTESQNLAKHLEDRDKGLELWKYYKLGLGDDLSASIYEEYYKLKEVEWLDQDVDTAFNTLHEVKLSSRLAIDNSKYEHKEIEHDNYTVILYKNSTIEGDILFDLIIIPKLTEAKIGDEFYVYVVSVRDNKSEEYDIVKTKLENAINKLLSTSDFKFN